MVRLRSWIVFGLSVSLLAVSVPLAAQEPRTITVRPGESIQAAIDAAPEGAVICLGAGEWREALSIRKSLSLRGAGIGSTTIRSAVGHLPVIAVTIGNPASPVARIEGFSIIGGTAGVKVSGAARAVIADCSLSGGDTGISSWDQSNVTVARCRIVDNRVYGVLLGDTSSTVVEGCVISGNTWGIMLHLWANASLTGNLIEGNDFGMSFYEPPCAPTGALRFRGRVVSNLNVFRGNVLGNACPPDLERLCTPWGGELDRRGQP